MTEDTHELLWQRVLAALRQRGLALPDNATPATLAALPAHEVGKDVERFLMRYYYPACHGGGTDCMDRQEAERLVRKIEAKAEKSQKRRMARAGYLSAFKQLLLYIFLFMLLVIGYNAVFIYGYSLVRIGTHAFAYRWQVGDSMAQAAQAEAEKDWPKAIGKYREALEAYPRNPYIFFRLASAYIETGADLPAAFYLRAYLSYNNPRDGLFAMLEGSRYVEAKASLASIITRFYKYSRIIHEESYGLWQDLPDAVKRRQAEGEVNPVWGIRFTPAPIEKIWGRPVMPNELSGYEGHRLQGALFCDSPCDLPSHVDQEKAVKEEAITVDFYHDPEGRVTCCRINLNDPDLADIKGAIERAQAGNINTVPARWNNIGFKVLFAASALCNGWEERIPTDCSDNVFKRLAAKAIILNDSGPIDKKTKSVLDLGQDSEDFLIYQIKVEGDDLHLFDLAKDGSGQVILVSRIDGVGYYFALNARQRPFAAAMSRDGEIFAVPINSVRPQLRQMMDFWTDWAAKNTTK